MGWKAARTQELAANDVHCCKINATNHPAEGSGHPWERDFVKARKHHQFTLYRGFFRMKLARMSVGFTLIELMITITLLGVFAALAVPSFATLINNNRTQAASNEVYALLQYARSIAAQERTNYSACLNDGEWTVKKTCSSTVAMRTLGKTASVDIKASTSEIVFHGNGAATAATIYACHDADPTSGFTIIVQNSGSTRIFPRGQDATSSMSTCQP